MAVYCSLGMTSLHNVSLREEMDLIKDIERDHPYRGIGILIDSASFVSVLEHATTCAAYVYRPAPVEAH